MGHLRHHDVARNMHVAVAAAGLGGIYQAGRMLFDASLRPTRPRKKESKDDKDKDESVGGAGLGLALMAGGLGAQAVAHLAQLAASRGSELQARALYCRHALLSTHALLHILHVHTACACARHVRHEPCGSEMQAELIPLHGKCTYLHRACVGRCTAHAGGPRGRRSLRCRCAHLRASQGLTAWGYNLTSYTSGYSFSCIVRVVPLRYIAVSNPNSALADARHAVPDRCGGGARASRPASQRRRRGPDGACDDL